MATQRSVAEKTKTFLIAGLLKDKGVYENRRLFLFCTIIRLESEREAEMVNQNPFKIVQKQIDACKEKGERLCFN